MDVRNINTDGELAALLSQVDAKINSGPVTGTDPDASNDFNNRMASIKKDVNSELRRHETAIENIARRVRDIDTAIDRAPKTNNRS